MRRFVLILLLAVGACAHSEPAAPEAPVYEYVRLTMGVKIRLKLLAADERTAFAAAAAAFDRVDALDAVLSDYRIDSETNRLHRDGRIIASADFLLALDQALHFAELSDGAFDPTVGPLVALWRARRKAGLSPATMPSEGEIAAARAHVGREKIRRTVDHEGRTVVALADPCVRLDFGGIGKGFALDQAAIVLRQHGIGAYLFEFGGDILAGDPPSGRDGWRIATLDGTEMLLSNAALSTSGDTEQFIMIDGVACSHIVDPRTGRFTVGRTRAMVTAKDATTSDALSTACSVLSPEAALKLVASIDGAAARITVRQKEMLIARETEGFAPRLREHKIVQNDHGDCAPTEGGDP